MSLNSPMFFHVLYTRAMTTTKMPSTIVAILPTLTNSRSVAVGRSRSWQTLLIISPSLRLSATAMWRHSRGKNYGDQQAQQPSGHRLQGAGYISAFRWVFKCWKHRGQIRIEDAGGHGRYKPD